VRYQLGEANSGNNVVTEIYIAAQDQVIWLGTYQGLSRFDMQTETWRTYRYQADAPHSLSANIVRAIYPAANGKLWVGTHSGGLNLFDPTTERFSRYQADRNHPAAISDNIIFSVYQAQDGTLWIGTALGGVNKLDPQRKKFRLYQPQANNPQSLSALDVFGLYIDRAGIVWIGTAGGGLNKFDPQTEQFTRYQHDDQQPQSLSHNFVHSILEDREGALWVGTWGGGLNKFDRRMGQFTAYKNDPNDPDSLSDNTVRAIAEDDDGNLWVGTASTGLNKFDRQTGHFRHYRYYPDQPDGLMSDNIWNIFKDRQGYLWISTGQGLEQFDPKTEQFTHYRHDDQNPQSLTANTVYNMYEDDAGMLWLATAQGLNRFDRTTQQFTHYLAQDGLPDNRVQNVVADQQGYLWLGTVKGLARFDPKTETFKVYDASDGLQGDFFREWAYARSANGELYFGGINGLNRFHPDEITDNPNLPPVVLTDLLLFNQSVPIGADSVLAQQMSSTEAITLAPDQTVFGLEFAALNYTSPNKNRYAYLMEGFDKAWVATTAQRRLAAYTNLNPGRYVFRVKATNNDGLWSDREVALNITILPPWWKTWWFRALVLSSMLGGLAWRWHRIEAQKRHLQQVVTERTAALSERENRLRTIFETSQAGVLLVDPRGVITFANQRMADMFKCVLADLIGSTYPDHIHPTEKQIGDQKMRQLIAGDIDAIALERHYVCADGSDFWGLLSGRRMEDEHGQLLEMVGIITDITERKQAEAALQQSEARFRLAFEDANIGMCLVDTSGHLVKVNQQMSAMFGYAPAELEQMTVNDLAHPDYQEVSPRFIRGAVAGEAEHTEFEKMYQHRDGHPVWGLISSSLLKDAQGQPLYFISHVQDITARKQAEAALRDSEALLNAVGEIARIGGWELDAATRTVRWTRETYRIHEIPESDRVPMDEAVNFYHPEDRPSLVAALQRALHQGAAFDLELRFLTAKNHPLWVRAIGQPVVEHGSITKLIGMFQDITEHKQADDALKHAKEAAEAANRAKSVFLANMSHELRTPLNGILGYAQILRLRGDLSDAQREGVAIIERSGDHLLGLINDILDLAKVEAGKVELHESDMRLLDLLNDIRSMIHFKTEAKSLTFAVDAAPALPLVIRADERRLRQVLLNLLGNAVKFTQQGSVTLRVGATPCGRPDNGQIMSPDNGQNISPDNGQNISPDNGQTRGAAPTNVLRFEVIDTGVGIVPDNLKRLFTPFEQFGDAASNAQGTGLGLAISRNLVRMMGGEMQVESAFGVGSRFWFDLPVTVIAPAAPETPARRRRIIGIDGTPPRLLVVDDDPVNRRVLIDALTPLGFEMREASNGREALLMLSQWRPQAVIIDLRMPDMDGVTLIRQVRQMPEYAEMTIIVSSASVYQEDQQYSLEAGAQAFLPKPVELAQLFQQLEQWLHLTWRYADVDAPAAPQATAMLLPPREEMKALWEHIALGDILEFRNALNTLKHADLRWQPFCDRLSELAQQFKLCEIRTILEESLAAERMTLQEHMAALPLELRTRLRDAASIANIAAIETIIPEILALDARLADALDAWAQVFDYGKILALLE